MTEHVVEIVQYIVCNDRFIVESECPICPQSPTQFWTTFALRNGNPGDIDVS